MDDVYDRTLSQGDAVETSLSKTEILLLLFVPVGHNAYQQLPAVLHYTMGKQFEVNLVCQSGVHGVYNSNSIQFRCIQFTNRMSSFTLNVLDITFFESVINIEK